MSIELKTLFEFEFLIMDMQKLVIEHRKKGTPEKTLQSSIERIDKLIEIYKTFDKYYYAAHFAKEKIMMIEAERLEMSAALTKEIELLKEENDKLLKTLNFNEQAA